MRKLAAVIAIALGATVLTASPAVAGRTVTISGGGWGHGIGMSQYGAYGRALNGKNAGQILRHYYSGISVSAREMPPEIRVGLAQFKKNLTFSSSAFLPDGGTVVWKVAGQKRRIARGGTGATWRVEPSDAAGMKLFKNDRQISKDGKTVFGSPERPLVLIYEKFGSLVRVHDKNNSYAYGKMDIGIYSSSRCGGNYCLRLVVSLPMQKYLYGLGEVPASWPQAVLRSQAIAGRTYAYNKVTRLGQHREPCDCAVYDSVIDQAYIGDAKRTGSGSYWEAWKGAVDATDAKVALYNGTPIQALYSSSSGGHTENNENVWGSGTAAEAIAYLRGVKDRADYARGNNPNHTWSVTMTYDEFEKKLNAAYGTGQLQDFRVIKPRGVSGRVSTVRPDGSGGAKIVGSNKTVRVDGWSLRSSLKLKDSLFWVDIQWDVGTRFRQRYDALGGAPGDATSAVYNVPRKSDRRLGRAQNFTKGRMTWTEAKDKVTWQWGKVLRKYNRLGRERSPLGMPTSDVWGPGRYLGGTYIRGLILWSADTGARTVRGEFRAAFRRAGGPKGGLGLPIKERQTRDTLPGGGRRQRFQTGTIYQRSSGTTAYALWGPIEAEYRRLGEATSPCGYPTADMVAETNQAAAAFERGVITWNVDDGVKVNCN